MFHKLIPFFKTQMRICNNFFLTPYEWPKGSKYPIVHRSAWRRNLYKVTLLAQWIYVLAMTFDFTATFKNNNKAAQMLGIVFLDCFMVTLSLRTVVLFKEDECLNMISSFLRFEQMNPEVIKQKPDMMGKFLMTLGILTSFGLPGLMTTILLVDPCKPPHLGYMLLKTGKTGCRIPEFHVRASLLLFDYLMWTNSIAPACYYVFEFMFLGLRCMDYYIQIISGSMNKRIKPAEVKLKIGSKWQRRNQSQSTKPAAEETLQVTKSNNKSLEAHHAHAFYVYRQIHLLNKKYDSVLQAVFLPSIIAAGLSCLIISLYACLKLHRQIPMPGLAFFPLLASDGLSVIFIIKVAAGVLNQSNRFLNIAKSNFKFSKKSLFKKLVRSLGKVKIRFGSTNFIDQLTPFIFIDFCFTNTVNLMLIT